MMYTVKHSPYAKNSIILLLSCFLTHTLFSGEDATKRNYSKPHTDQLVTILDTLSENNYQAKRSEITELLANGADPNKYPTWKLSLLRATVMHNDIDIAKKALEHGADPNQTDSLYHNTVVVEAKSVDMIQLLYNHQVKLGMLNLPTWGTLLQNMREEQERQRLTLIKEFIPGDPAVIVHAYAGDPHLKPSYWMALELGFSAAVNANSVIDSSASPATKNQDQARPNHRNRAIRRRGQCTIS